MLKATPGGPLLANVNQWRRSVNLPATTAEQLPGLIKEVAIADRSFQLIELTGRDPLPTHKHPTGLVVAFCDTSHHRWFFKLAGDADLVTEQKPVLLEFLRSVEFDPPS